MGIALEVSDVDWDGAHFTAYSDEGIIEGNGSFTQNDAATGGVIIGTIQRGPEQLVEKQVSIKFDGQYGILQL